MTLRSLRLFSIASVFGLLCLIPTYAKTNKTNFSNQTYLNSLQDIRKNVREGKITNEQAIVLLEVLQTNLVYQLLIKQEIARKQSNQIIFRLDKLREGGRLTRTNLNKIYRVINRNNNKLGDIYKESKNISLNSRYIRSYTYRTTKALERRR